MKKISLITCILILLVMLFGSFGCNTSGQEKIDSTKTQLFVGNYNGGNGEAWLRKLKNRFEEENKDVCFEPGTDKKGVQIIIENGKQTMEGPTILTNIAVSQYEVYFTEGVSYNEFVNSNLLLDITDIMTENLPGESRSILDKIDDGQKDYLNKNGKYYGIPHYDSYRGIIYDWDLFNEKSLFFQEGGGFTNASGNLAVGPSGIEDGYDAGLPATYEDFFTLCDYMTQLNIIPISWSGEFINTYTSYLFSALYADYEGADSYNLINNGGIYSGRNTTHLVTGFDEDDNPIISTEPTTISISNIGELIKQPGKYYALKFLEDIIKNNYYSPLSSNSTQSQVAAQADFLYSRFETSSPIAMLIEGQWWTEEASDTFRDMERAYGEEASATTRKFGFMPMPKVSSDKLGQPTLIYDTNQTMCFINGNMTDQNKIALAKKFLQFANTDQSLIEFTTTTGCTKCLDYDLGTAVNSLSYFSRTVYELSKNADFAYGYSPSYAILNQIKTAAPRLKSLYTVVKGTPYSIPAKAFIYNNISAKDYFNGLKYI